jgi:hypothetical protein
VSRLDPFEPPIRRRMRIARAQAELELSTRALARSNSRYELKMAKRFERWRLLGLLAGT